MTKTESQIETLKLALAANDKGVEAIQADIDFLLDELATLKSHQSTLLGDARVLTQRLDDQQKHIDKWDQRIWAFVGALLMLASGLNVTLSDLKRTP
jgi:chromosome segregation ATPase